jgi:four helix bundle protein
MRTTTGLMTRYGESPLTASLRLPSSCGWDDLCTLSRNYFTRPVAAQLYRSLGSISANMAEGYSRSAGRDRARLFEYALGSAREARAWYRLAHPVIGSTTCRHRLDTLSQICALLVTAIPGERRRDLWRQG